MSQQVSLTEAARRSGLAVGAEQMALVCSQSGVAVVEGAVAVELLLGEVCEVALPVSLEVSAPFVAWAD